jgi:prevent-host-death family protein
LPLSSSQRRYGAGMPDSSKITITELRNETSRMIGRVEAGETLVVTRYGRVVAVITPIESQPAPSSSSLR